MTTVLPETEQDIERVVLDEPELSNNDNNAKGKRHIVNPPMNIHIWKPGMEAQDIVDIAYVRGLEVIALCGYKWVPSKNPANLKTCDACMDEAAKIVSGD